MTKKIETVTVDFDNLNHMISCKMRLPSKYAFRNALGDFVFIKTSDRGIAEKWLKEEYGGMYSIQCFGAADSTGRPATVRATATRRGQKKY